MQGLKKKDYSKRFHSFCDRNLLQFLYPDLLGSGPIRRGEVIVLDKIERALFFRFQQNFLIFDAAIDSYSFEPIVYQTHFDELSESPRAKLLESLQSLRDAGGCLLVGAEDASSLPAEYKQFRVLQPTERPAINVGFSILQKFLSEEPDLDVVDLGVSRESLRKGGHGPTFQFSELVRDDGAVRVPGGWVKSKMGKHQLRIVLTEIEHMLFQGSIDLSWIRLAATGHLASSKFAASEEPETSRSERKPEVRTVERTPRLNDMPGIRRVRKRLASLLRRAKNQANRTGILLVGPPGTGKTMLGRMLAQESGRAFVPASYSQWQSQGHLGDFQKAMRASFEEARRKSPSILFIDELDSFPERGVGGNSDSYDRKVVNSFLEEIQGFHDRGDVLLVGATNHREVLDPALTRKGRFGDHIRLPNPDLKDIAEIVDYYLKKEHAPYGVEPAVTGEALSRRCFASAGSDIRALVEEAFDLAREQHKPVALSHFVEAMVTTTNDGIEDERPEVPEEKYETAIHEMGHAFLAHMLFGARAKIGLITVNPGLNSLGHVVWEFDPGKEPRSVVDKAGRIVVSLGGRCAEILHGGIGQLGFGASSDLANATRAAELMVVHGVTPGVIDKFVSPKDEVEVRRLGAEWLKHLNGRTMSLLEPHVDFIRELAKELVAIGDMEGEAFHRRLQDAGIEPGAFLASVLAMDGAADPAAAIQAGAPASPGAAVPQFLHRGVSSLALKST